MEKPTYSKMWPRYKWLLRHLDWTLVLYLLSWLPISLMITMLSNVVGGEGASIIYLFTFYLWLVGLYYLMIWNLKHKGRSKWNLSYIFVPFIGFLIFLCISDKKQGEDNG